MFADLFADLASRLALSSNDDQKNNLLQAFMLLEYLCFLTTRRGGAARKCQSFQCSGIGALMLPPP